MPRKTFKKATVASLPKFTMQELLEAGVHYGHKTMRWNPKMGPYIYGAHNGVHIIDLQKTVPLLNRALLAVYEVARNNGKVLFVGTKRQAGEAIANYANSAGQYYVNHRWLGGMLTNWVTVSNSIKRLLEIEETLGNDELKITKKEHLTLSRQKDKLRLSLGGILDMDKQKPDLLFIIDTNRESLAIAEAKKLGIPIVAVVDTNSNPKDIDYPIPGNDDAIRAINLYCRLVSDTILAGIEENLLAAGVDVGEREEIPANATNEEEQEDKDSSAA